MNKIKVIIVLFIFLLVLSVGCSEVRKAYYESGALKNEVNFKNDVEEGLFKIYYESGELESAYTIKNGEIEGPYKEYDESGKLKGQYTYKNGGLKFDKGYSFIFIHFVYFMLDF